VPCCLRLTVTRNHAGPLSTSDFDNLIGEQRRDRSAQRFKLNVQLRTGPLHGKHLRPAADTCLQLAIGPFRADASVTVAGMSGSVESTPSRHTCAHSCSTTRNSTDDRK
jgi:hypothetical protein